MNVELLSERVCLDCGAVPMRVFFGAQGESFDRCSCFSEMVEGGRELLATMDQVQRQRPSDEAWRAQRGAV